MHYDHPSIFNILKSFGLFSVLSLTALSAAAQVERIKPSGNGAMAGVAGQARYIHSGALLLASFDTNQDFLVTDAEIESGARNTFKIADADNDGFMTAIEQRNWASKITGEGDVLENSQFFHSEIPNQVTEDEFVNGIQIFSTNFENEDGNILFTSFIVTPKDKEKKADEVDSKLERLRRLRE